MVGDTYSLKLFAQSCTDEFSDFHSICQNPNSNPGRILDIESIKIRCSMLTSLTVLDTGILQYNQFYFSLTDERSLLIDLVALKVFGNAILISSESSYEVRFGRARSATAYVNILGNHWRPDLAVHFLRFHLRPRRRGTGKASPHVQYPRCPAGWSSGRSRCEHGRRPKSDVIGCQPVLYKDALSPTPLRIGKKHLLCF